MEYILYIEEKQKIHGQKNAIAETKFTLKVLLFNLYNTCNAYTIFALPSDMGFLIGLD